MVSDGELGWLRYTKGAMSINEPISFFLPGLPTVMAQNVFGACNRWRDLRLSGVLAIRKVLEGLAVPVCRSNGVAIVGKLCGPCVSDILQKDSSYSRSIQASTTWRCLVWISRTVNRACIDTGLYNATDWYDRLGESIWDGLNFRALQKLFRAMLSVLVRTTHDNILEVFSWL